MSSKILLLVVVLGGVLALGGCSSETPKGGVPIQKGDYQFAPGGGAKPGSAGATTNPGH